LAWRIDRRAAQTQPPELLRLPAPLNQQCSCEPRSSMVQHFAPLHHFFLRGCATVPLAVQRAPALRCYTRARDQRICCTILAWKPEYAVCPIASVRTFTEMAIYNCPAAAARPSREQQATRRSSGRMREGDGPTQVGRNIQFSAHPPVCQRRAKIRRRSSWSPASREKFREGIAEGDGGDLLGGGRARANGADPGAERSPDQLGLGRGGKYCPPAAFPCKLPRTQTACHDRKMWTYEDTERA